MAHQEIFRRCGGGVQIDSPVEKRLAASYGKDNSVHVVDGDGFDDHCFCSVTPVSFDVGFFFSASGPGVYPLRVLRCKAY